MAAPVSKTPAIGDVERNLTPDHKVAMADLVLAFAKLDSVLSALLLTSYGIELDRGAILIQNMDIGNKLGRLKNLYTHVGRLDDAKYIFDTKVDFENHKEPRNTVCHAMCVGFLKSDPDYFVFSPIRAFKGKDGQLEVSLVPRQVMAKSKAWALRCADELFKRFDAELVRP